MNIIIYIILFYFILSIIFYFLYVDYENYINEPYITVVPILGLNNRLRVILSYLYLANKENKKLKIIWKVSDKECLGQFDQLFEPLPNTTIEYITDKNNEQYDFRTYSIYNSDFEKENYYSLLKPLPHIQIKIDNIKEKLGSEYIACHIRRTDALKYNWYVDNLINDSEYIHFINQYLKDLKIYIATDCRDTQKKFIDIYGDRLIYQKIENNNNFRQTSLEEAVIDMFVCTDAKYFLGSNKSSFTDTINNLRK
jgi:hypothetical protein